MATEHPEVTAFFKQLTGWRTELTALRNLCLAEELTEQYKWRQPCYTHAGKNVVILGALKDCCTISFFKGVLLKDSEKLLTKPGENTRTARVVRFTDAEAIHRNASALKGLLREAIKIERNGREVEQAAPADQPVPAELQARFDEDRTLEAAFHALTPGRRRAYLLHFAAAKQSKTRATRIEKYRSRILEGKGMHDCVCGLSRRMPACDGSHSRTTG